MKMNEHNIRLTAKEILEKDFKMSMRGYNADEVDKFLDIIIQDYEVFQKKIEFMEQENEKLKQRLERQTEKSQRTATTQPIGSTNYDILQRLSNLEMKVFGSKLYE